MRGIARVERGADSIQGLLRDSANIGPFRSTCAVFLVPLPQGLDRYSKRDIFARARSSRSPSLVKLQYHEGLPRRLPHNDEPGPMDCHWNPDLVLGNGLIGPHSRMEGQCLRTCFTALEFNGTCSSQCHYRGCLEFSTRPSARTLTHQRPSFSLTHNPEPSSAI